MKHLPWIVATGCLALHLGASAMEVAYYSDPTAGAQRMSVAADSRADRLDAARHIYASYATRIDKGRLPPLIHAVVVVENTVDEGGQLRDVKVVRGPSHAPDVTAAVMQMIRRAGPMPTRPSRRQREVHRDLARPQGRPLPARRPDRRSGLTPRRYMPAVKPPST